MMIQHFASSLFLTHGVIGNTAGFGPAILGSSPSGSTKTIKQLTDYLWVVFVYRQLVAIFVSASSSVGYREGLD